MELELRMRIAGLYVSSCEARVALRGCAYLFPGCICGFLSCIWGFLVFLAPRLELAEVETCALVLCGGAATCGGAALVLASPVVPLRRRLLGGSTCLGVLGRGL
eukprot:9476249-Pyramimonas_sp.AAC.3